MNLTINLLIIKKLFALLISKAVLDNNLLVFMLVCAGSPFTVKVNGPPDPSKVRVSGPGIHNGILQQYNGSFTVNTQGAGPGELTVKIRGPKGLRLCEVWKKII